MWPLFRAYRETELQNYELCIICSSYQAAAVPRDCVVAKQGVSLEQAVAKPRPPLYIHLVRYCTPVMKDIMLRDEWKRKGIARRESILYGPGFTEVIQGGNSVGVTYRCKTVAQGKKGCRQPGDRKGAREVSLVLVGGARAVGGEERGDALRNADAVHHFVCSRCWLEKRVG
ncbi:unnamed protein product [Ectocarpus sp. 4 AP-2014]